MRWRRPSSTVIIWLTAGILAALSCSLYFSAAHYQGEYLPVGNDSFYHARRILDAVADPAAFYQFDPKIHAPEGSLLVWPWGYDYLMAQLVRAGLAVGLSADPMAILIWIPVAAVFFSVGLLVLIARRLGLATTPVAIAALCMALSPTTQFLHGTGQIDHHYAELICVLAALAGGLRWLREPDDARTAAILAGVLGLAPAIHNGLFVLQVPLLATLLVRWLIDLRPARKPALTFAVVLLVVTTAIAMPSQAFRAGRFEFYTLSLFHLYIAFATALVVVLLSALPRTSRGYAGLVAAGALLVLPILAQIGMARSFVTGSFKWLETIAEMKSPLVEMFDPRGRQIAAYIYSYLIWLAPLTFLLCLVQCWRERHSFRLLFWVTAVVGLALLASQVRMHYFGDFALYLPWLIVADDYVRQRPLHAKTTWLLVSLVLVLLFAPALRHQLVAPVSTANDNTFEDTRSMYAALSRACADDPGLVLADNNAGHYIRYYTRCSVMVNNFLLTPQHFAKMDEAEHLFSLPASELIGAAPQVKYVLVRPLDIRRADDPKQGYRYWFFFAGRPRLLTDLLLSPRDALPAGYILLDEIRFRDVDNIPYARLFRIERPPASAPRRVVE